MPRTPRRPLFFAAVALFAATALAEDDARGRELYAPCAACHGTDAQGNRAVQAPKLAGLPAPYIAQQLRSFRNGLRGANEADAYGAQMARMAEQLWNDGEVQSVAAYIASLAPVASEATVRGGKASRGKGVYATCAACHGLDGAGNTELGAPPLANRDDWYVASQLEAFRNGLRGTHDEDGPGQQMRAAVAALADEQAVLDVVAYLHSLRSGEAGSRRR